MAAPRVFLNQERISQKAHRKTVLVQIRSAGPFGTQRLNRIWFSVVQAHGIMSTGVQQLQVV
jgi:hypothetical protein